MTGNDYNINENVTNNAKTRIVYSALAYLRELETHELITPEEFFNEFIYCMNSIYKEYCIAIFDAYDKDVET